jgi:hypothetical protein
MIQFSRLKLRRLDLLRSESRTWRMDMLINNWKSHSQFKLQLMMLSKGTYYCLKRCARKDFGIWGKLHRIISLRRSCLRIDAHSKKQKKSIWNNLRRISCWNQKMEVLKEARRELARSLVTKIQTSLVLRVSMRTSYMQHLAEQDQEVEPRVEQEMIMGICRSHLLDRILWEDQWAHTDNYLNLITKKLRDHSEEVLLEPELHTSLLSLLFTSQRTEDWPRSS